MEKQKEIDELDKKIQELRSQKDKSKKEVEKASAEKSILDNELARSSAQIRKTEVLVENIGEEQIKTQEQINTVSNSIADKKNALRDIMRSLYEHENQSWIAIFLDTWSLSDVLAERDVFISLQQRMVDTIREMKEQQEELRHRQEELEQQKTDSEQLSALLEVQHEDLEATRTTKSNVLALKRNEQATYEHKIKEAQQARDEIQQQVFRLKQAGVEMSLKTAIDMAQYAGSLTGVRPALLLAVLKVESNVGERVGTGVFPDDMHPRDQDAFVRITSKIGLNPKEAKIAARPRSLKGWGGAMGPAQIMPGTWERIESRLLQLTKKTVVNPYDLADAFVATAVLLSDSGATQPGKEFEAVSRYIAGPNWQYYTWYGERVMAVAEEYEKELKN